MIKINYKPVKPAKKIKTVPHEGFFILKGKDNNSTTFLSVCAGEMQFFDNYGVTFSHSKDYTDFFKYFKIIAKVTDFTITDLKVIEVGK